MRDSELFFLQGFCESLNMRAPENVTYSTVLYETIVPATYICIDIRDDMQTYAFFSCNENAILKKNFSLGKGR
jgi:hypothetical protein